MPIIAATDDAARFDPPSHSVTIRYGSGVAVMRANNHIGHLFLLATRRMPNRMVAAKPVQITAPTNCWNHRPASVGSRACMRKCRISPKPPTMVARIQSDSGSATPRCGAEEPSAIIAMSRGTTARYASREPSAIEIATW